MSPVENFPEMWEKYMDIYHSGDNVKIYEDALTAEVRRRTQGDE